MTYLYCIILFQPHLNLQMLEFSKLKQTDVIIEFSDLENLYY